MNYRKQICPVYLSDSILQISNEKFAKCTLFCLNPVCFLHRLVNNRKCALCNWSSDAPGGAPMCNAPDSAPNLLQSGEEEKGGWDIQTGSPQSGERGEGLCALKCANYSSIIVYFMFQNKWDPDQSVAINPVHLVMQESVMHWPSWWIWNAPSQVVSRPLNDLFICIWISLLVIYTLYPVSAPR